jgi:hypothetical protein
MATWLIDDNGNIVFRQEYFKAARTWSQKVIRRGIQSTPTTGVGDYADIPSVRGISGDGKSAVLAFTTTNKAVLKAVSLDSGEATDLTEAPDLSATGLFDRLSSRIVRFTKPGSAVPHFIDPSRSEIWSAIVSSHPEYKVSDVSYSDDFKYHVIGLERDHSTFYELYDSEHGTALNIGSAAGSLTLK